MMRRLPIAVTGALIVCAGAAADGQGSALASSQATAFMGTWMFTMSEPPELSGSRQTVRIWDEKGVAAATYQIEGSPSRRVTGVARDGDMLVLTIGHHAQPALHENGAPIWAVIALTLDGTTMRMAQLLEKSATVKRGTGRKEAAFEVASIKRNRLANQGGPFGLQPGGRFVATNATLYFLIRFAYETAPWSRALEPFQVTGGPEWVRSDRFDVDARAATDLTLAQARLMLQTLLAERFMIQVHRENRDAPIYRLTMARDDRIPGKQLRRTSLDCTPPLDPFRPPDPRAPAPCGYFGMTPGIDPASGQSFQSFRGMTMEAFAGHLRSFLGRTVVDATGLEGYYDGDFEFTAEIAVPPPPPGIPNPYAGRTFGSIFSVLPQQLGLRLESSRGPVDVLVIDRAEPPTEN